MIKAARDEVLANLQSHIEKFPYKTFSDLSIGVAPSMFFDLMGDFVSRQPFQHEAKAPGRVFTFFGCRIYPIHNGIELTYKEAAAVFFSELKERDA